MPKLCRSFGLAVAPAIALREASVFGERPSSQVEDYVRPGMQKVVVKPHAYSEVQVAQPGSDASSADDMGTFEKNVDKTFSAMFTDTCDSISHLDKFSSATSVGKCQSCMGKAGQCAWCPLTQTCMSSAKQGWGARACPFRVELDTDIVIPDDCSRRATKPWVDAVALAYGESPGSSVQHADAQRCIEWSMKWGVSTDSNLPETQTAKAEDVGRWACMSVLMRDALLREMEQPPTGGKPASLAQQTATVGALLQENEATVQHGKILEEDGTQPVRGSYVNASRVPGLPARHRGQQAVNDATSAVQLEEGLGDPMSEWESSRWSPAICDVITQGSQGAPCEVVWYGKRDFSALRKKATQPWHQGPDDITADLVKSLKEGPIVPFNEDPVLGAKNGGYARTTDKKYWVKVSATGSGNHAEAENLWSMVIGYKNNERLDSFLYQHPESLLNRIYSCARISLPRKPTKYSGLFSGNKNFEVYIFLMGDPSYGHEKVVTSDSNYESSLTYNRYVLYSRQSKTEATESKFMKKMGDLQAIDEGQMHVRNSQCQNMQEDVAKDLDYVEGYGYYESALYIGRAKAGFGRTPPKCSGKPQEPLCLMADSYAYTVSVFDYLRKQPKLSMRHYGAEMKAVTMEVCSTTKANEPVQRRSIWFALIAAGIAIAAFIGFFLYMNSNQNDESEGSGVTDQPSDENEWGRAPPDSRPSRTSGRHPQGPPMHQQQAPMMQQQQQQMPMQQPMQFQQPMHPQQAPAMMMQQQMGAPQMGFGQMPGGPSRGGDFGLG